MSNYLKKLAYVHDAMRDLTMEKKAGRRDRIANGGWYFGKNMGFGPMFYNGPMPVQRTAPAGTAPVSAPASASSRGHVAPVTRQSSPSPRSASAQPQRVPQIVPPNRDMSGPITKANTSSRTFQSELTDDQLKRNIDNYQTRMIQQHINLNRVSKGEAEAYYKNQKNRWYNTNDMTALREQMANNKRLREIATGARMAPTWSTPGSGGVRNKRQTYNQARESMQRYRAAKDRQAKAMYARNPVNAVDANVRALYQEDPVRTNLPSVLVNSNPWLATPQSAQPTEGRNPYFQGLPIQRQPQYSIVEKVPMDLVPEIVPESPLEQRLNNTKLPRGSNPLPEDGSFDYTSNPYAA